MYKGKCRLICSETLIIDLVNLYQKKYFKVVKILYINNSFTKIQCKPLKIRGT